MSRLARGLRIGGGFLLGLAVISCGGGDTIGGSSSGGGPVGAASNVVSVAANGGPNGNATNLLYTTVTVCEPGSTTNCQTIDNVQVDTGSTGLRLLASVLTVTLQPIAEADGAALVECYAYVDGYTWGPVALAEVQISGERASSVPVELIGDGRFPNVPSDCSSTGPAENTVASFGANGILGIGFAAQDCGDACAGNAIPGVYYACTTASCEPTTVALTSQVPNPVTLFAKDNNGTIISLSSVASGGAGSVSGSLIFGLDTQSNNASASTTRLQVDGNEDDETYGEFSTVFDGQTLTESFIDSGSNGYFFNDSALPTCPAPNTGFYCPTSTESFSATLESYGGGSGSASASFSVASADDVPEGYFAYPGLAGTTSLSSSFDWGLGFFYGRRVVTAIQGASSSSGSAPYVAF